MVREWEKKFQVQIFVWCLQLSTSPYNTEYWRSTGKVFIVIKSLFGVYLPHLIDLTSKNKKSWCEPIMALRHWWVKRIDDGPPYKENSNATHMSLNGSFIHKSSLVCYVLNEMETVSAAAEIMCFESLFPLCNFASLVPKSFRLSISFSASLLFLLSSALARSEQTLHSLLLLLRTS